MDDLILILGIAAVIFGSVFGSVYLTVGPAAFWPLMRAVIGG